ncbi:MAG: hypothetical protein ACREOV_02215, partial [Candidatus Dormibacteraceae bacterium]
AGPRARAKLRWRTLVPAVILVAAAFYTYSYTAIAWFGGAVVIWLVAETACRPWRVLSRAGLRRVMAAAGSAWVSVLLLVLLLVPISGQMRSFFSSVGVSPSATSAIPVNALGNLIHPLSGYESLGVWWSPDFRVDPANVFRTGELAAFALAVMVFGFIWSLRRGERLLPAAVAASLLIWWRAGGTQSPYVVAKALVIVAPLIMALDLRALLTGGLHGSAIRVLVSVVAAAFCVFAAYSSYLVLRNEPVQASASGHELAAFSARIQDGSVLYLGDDQYAPWDLRPAAVSALDPNVLSQGDAAPNPAKPAGGQLDFDSVTATSLDRFTYVITSNSPFTSQPPPNFQLVQSLPLYRLWRRTGPTVARQVIDPAGTPGAVLSCDTPLGRRLRRSHGVASITSAPITAPGAGLLPGWSRTLEVPLPEGEWDLSIQYVSAFELDLEAEGHQWSMPAVTAPPQEFYAVGQVQGHGVKSPVSLDVHLPKPSPFTSEAGLLYANITTLAATRTPNTHQLVPLRSACGRYVDWYRLSPAHGG